MEITMFETIDEVEAYINEDNFDNTNFEFQVPQKIYAESVSLLRKNVNGSFIYELVDGIITFRNLRESDKYSGFYPPTVGSYIYFNPVKLRNAGIKIGIINLDNGDWYFDAVMNDLVSAAVVVAIAKLNINGIRLFCVQRDMLFVVDIPKAMALGNLFQEKNDECVS